MTLDEFVRAVSALDTHASELVSAATTAAELEAARNTLLGRKSGELSNLMKSLPTLPAEDRREAGAAVNRVKTSIEELLVERTGSLVETVSSRPQIDLTMPSRESWKGGRHPVTVVIEEIESIFRELGFTIALGPEAETEWYNFTSLNFPANHPAMDMHDTLYLSDEVLLRTHTSPVQIRTMQNTKPPIRILAPGNVYRRDFFDASHAPMFSQIEGLAVDEGIGFVDLKATLTHFANRFFGATKTRFRPSYFPFTEPSAEMDVECQLCHGSGCSSCKNTGWMEILGSGMVHPNVLTAAGLDAERYTGWAFGMGPARIAMLRYKLPDIRLLYDSDMRFLAQVSS
ncbi:MAG TPA: phenylalanine--tRNA ligase subunit alpha [Gemmatimonadaceae bacterium]|nr:phenylalanine--tRNA ligase subunit alpha [Gemmatimonadaceae bacterium]